MTPLSKTISAALIGAAAGAVTVLLIATNTSARDADAAIDDFAPASLTPGVGSVDVETLTRGGSGVAEHADVYAKLERADPATLATLLAEAARLPISAERTLLLSALVARIAAQDPDEALLALSHAYPDPRTARELGILMLDFLAPDSGSIDRVLAALPQIDERRYRIQAVVRLAGVSPQQAVDLSIEIEDEALRSEALREVARVWVERGGEDPMTYAESVPDSLRFSYEAAMLSQLALIDMGSARAYVDDRYGDSDDQRERLIQTIVQGVMRENSAVAVELTEMLSGLSRMRVERSVAGWLARLDPVAAMAFAEREPVGPSPFNPARNAIAEILGEQDADAALAWIRSLDPMPAGLAADVLSGVARIDPLRAIDIGEELAIVGSLNDVDSLKESAPLIAARVLAIQDPKQRQQWLQTLVRSWSSVDKQAALDWVVVNNQSVGSNTVADVAQRWGRESPDAALGYTEQLPSGLRSDWVRSVVTGSMLGDPVAAIDWVAQYRGLPIYDEAAAVVVESGVWVDPEPAAALFRTLSESRQAAVGRQLTSNWARRDMTAARNWVIALPNGPGRDSALTGIIEGFNYGVPDATILSLYSSNRAREEAVVDTVTRIAFRDELAARRLLDEYVSDPALYQQAEHLMRRPDR